MYRRSLLLLVLLVAVAGCGGGGKSSAKFPASPYAGSPWLGATPPGFTLRDQSGSLVSLAGQRGRYAIVTFLYTNCPDVCPLIASQLNQALRQLGPKRDDVRVLAVSVDPKGDTPASVRRFIAVHRLVPQFRYLTGTRAQLAPIWKAWHIAVGTDLSRKQSFHSAYELLLDPAGKARLIYSSDVKASDVLHDLHKLGLT